MIDINKYSIVSFDLFDTLIKRDVKKPVDVFKLVERRMPDNIKCNNFSKDRINAELNLYRKKVCEEITLDEIYENFPSEYNTQTLEACKKMEIETELEVCVFNENLRDLYKNVVNSKKKIIIVTDIYLPEDVILKILKKNSIKYDKLYVSSKIKLKKKTGNLFKYVINDLNSKPSNIVHIGDNKISDMKIPQSLGISTYKINTYVNNSIYNNVKNIGTSFEYDLLSSFINNREIKLRNRYEKIGYETLGPLLYGFSKWLYNKTNNNFDKVLFLSRDGQLMREAFEIIDINKNILHSYFYASRRALIVPNLKDCHSVESMFEKFTFPKYISMKKIIKKFGIDFNLNIIKDLETKYGLILDEQFEYCGYNHLKENNKLFLDELFDFIIENSKDEFENEIRYFKNNIFSTHKKIAIVDIGWYGNMQINLEKSISNIGNYDVSGFYVGLVPKYSNVKKLKMEGYLFNTTDDDFEKYIREKNFNSLFELLFSADHGTVIKYLDGTPVLAEYEYSNEQLENIKQIQKGALIFINDIVNNGLFNNIEFSAEDVSWNIFNFGNNPEYEDAKDIGEFLFLDNSLAKLSNYKGRYYFNLVRLFNDFRLSQWKIAFLKIIFKISLPYERICRILRGNNIR